MSELLAMGGYAAYVWSAFTIAFLLMLGLFLQSRRAARRSEAELEVLMKCLVSLSATAPDAQVMVVDDCSPERGLVATLALICQELGFELVQKDENSGFSRTVNVGPSLPMQPDGMTRKPGRR